MADKYSVPNKSNTTSAAPVTASVSSFQTQGVPVSGAALHQAAIVKATDDLNACEFLSRVAEAAFRRQMVYIYGFRKAAISGDWGLVEYPDAAELDQWDKEFFGLRWNDGKPTPPKGVNIATSDLDAVVGAYQMRAFVYASKQAIGDPLVFFSRSDYNLFYATGLGLPAPLGYAANSPEWQRAIGDNYARGPLKVRWTKHGGEWTCILRGDSFGLKDSIRFDWSAIRLQGDLGTDGIVALPNNPNGAA